MELKEKILMQSINLNVLSNIFTEYSNELIKENIDNAIKNYKQYVDNYIVNLTNKNALECSFIIKGLLEGTMQLYLYSTNNNISNIDLNRLIEIYESTEEEKDTDTKLKKKYILELKQSIYNDKKINIKKPENRTTLERIKKINNNTTNIFKIKNENNIENIVELTEEFLLILEELTHKLENIKESKENNRKNLLIKKSSATNE